MANHFTRSALGVLVPVIITLAAQSAQTTKKAGPDEAKPLPVRAPFNMSNYFFPSGWMGNFEEKGRKLLEVNTAFKGKPRQGSSNGLCIKITYKGSTWVGIYWQSPDGNWGDKPGRTVTGANRVTFWAAGDQGNEVVEFKSGGSGIGSKYQDTFEVTTGRLSLERDWKHYEISLANQQLSNVIGAFAVIIHNDGVKTGTAIYLDKIQFE
jgi:hypothetical protein